MKTWEIAVVISAALYLCAQVHFVDGLECYVCSNQTGNTEKCLNTIKTCEPDEDACGTEIRWGSMPYFSQGALKQYYVSKRCMNKQKCQQKRKHYMTYCTHIWYEDWQCYECCLGDRCNYFVISASKRIDTTLSALLISLAASLLLIRKALPCI